MVTAEFGTGKLLKPFLVMDGVTGATLDKKYATWATQAPHTCEVTFQKKHWFDKHITLRWLKWLKKQFPDGSKVLLVWDHAPAHDDKTVDAWLALNIDWLRVMCIPGGLTSIMQVCDLTANAQLKAEFKVLYARWRAGSLRKQQEEYDEKLAEARDASAAAAVAPPKPALKMDRGAIITMVEQTIANFNKKEDRKLLEERCIHKTFTRAGQNPWCENTDAFKQHLDDLQNNPVYGVLLTPGQALDNIEATLLANQFEMMLVL